MIHKMITALAFAGAFSVVCMATADELAPDGSMCRETDFVGNSSGLLQCRMEGWRATAASMSRAVNECETYVGAHCRPPAESDFGRRIAERLPASSRVATNAPAKSPPAKTAPPPRPRVSTPAASSGLPRNCRINPGNALDTDCDGVPDMDPDGVGALRADNCPGTPNADQTDQDGDGVGAACDDLDNRVDALTARIAALEARPHLTAAERQLLTELRALRDEVVASRGEFENLGERLVSFDERLRGLERRMGEVENALRRGFRQARLGLGVGTLGPDMTAIWGEAAPVLVLGDHFQMVGRFGIGGATGGEDNYLLSVSGGGEFPLGNPLGQTRFGLGIGVFDRELHGIRGRTTRRFWGGYGELSVHHRFNEVRPGKFNPGILVSARPELGSFVAEQTEARMRFGVSGTVSAVLEWP